mgnify:FL=1
MSLLIALTPRDVDVLAFLHSQGVATFDQLCRGYFHSDASCRMRLSKLVRAGYIESVPISSGVRAVPSRMRELRAQIRQSGSEFQKMRVYRVGPRLLRSRNSRRPLLGEPIFWQHQLGLGEILPAVKSILPQGGVLLSDTQLRQEC